MLPFHLLYLFTIQPFKCFCKLRAMANFPGLQDCILRTASSHLLQNGAPPLSCGHKGWLFEALGTATGLLPARCPWRPAHRCWEGGAGQHWEHSGQDHAYSCCHYQPAPDGEMCWHCVWLYYCISLMFHTSQHLLHTCRIDGTPVRHICTYIYTYIHTYVQTYALTYNADIISTTVRTVVHMFDIICWYLLNWLHV